jgi:hypothetical protein
MGKGRKGETADSSFATLTLGESRSLSVLESEEGKKESECRGVRGNQKEKVKKTGYRLEVAS